MFSEKHQHIVLTKNGEYFKRDVSHIREMKILRIIARLNVGGPSIQVIDLVGKLADVGHETVLLTGPCPEEEGSMETLYFEECAGKGSITFVPALQREIDFRKDWIAFRALVGIIRRERPDIVHTHTAKAGLLGRLAALHCRLFHGHKIKLFHTFHGHVFHSYFGKLTSRAFIWLERIVALWTDAVIAISLEQKKDLVGRYKIAPARKVEAVRLGFDLEELLELEPISGGDMELWCLNVGIIGRLTDIKNHELFFAFIKALSRYYPVHAHVYGEGSRERELKEKAGLIEDGYLKISFSGWFDYVKRADIYRDLDIVVCSSRNEGTPVVLIETMAAARLVVSTDVGGVRDLVGANGQRGYYLSETDPSSTADYMRQVLFENRYEGVIREARRFVMANYRLERLVVDIRKLYES